METPRPTGRLRLTEENLKKLQPSLIRPMSPVSISSGASDDAAEVTTDARLERLKSWVYNAMQTLVDLGSEGNDVVQADELYISGPGEVRLRGQEAAEEETGGDEERKEKSDSDPGRNKTHHDAEAVGVDQAQAAQPDLSDPAYWEAKLKYLEGKCQPLAQARRKRRRLAPEEAGGGEDGARQMSREAAARQDVAVAAGLGLTPEEVEDVRLDQARIEESKLLWRDKRGRIAAWAASILPVEPPKPFSPHEPPSAARLEPAGPTPSPIVAEFVSRPPSSDSSVVEISVTQFSHALGGRHQASEALTTPAALTAAAPTKTEGSANAAPPPGHKRQPSRKQQSCAATAHELAASGPAMMATPNASASPGRTARGHSHPAGEMRSASPVPIAATGLGKRRRPDEAEGGPIPRRPCVEGDR